MTSLTIIVGLLRLFSTLGWHEVTANGPWRISVVAHSRSRKGPARGAVLHRLGLDARARSITGPDAFGVDSGLWRGDPLMLYYAAVFFIIAIVAAVLGFGGIAAGAASIAKILFVVFLVGAVAAVLLSLFRRA
jgi:uncharacterized membrane protein YtjA (UPF0391 family)